MKLFQFWDKPDPPAQVAAWMDGFRDNNPEFEYVRMDTAAARAFIAEHYGAREVEAFDACAVPAMLADYIRLCMLDVHGGLWVDADNQSLRPVSELVERAPHSMMFLWTGLFNTGFMLFRRPRDPFIRACLELTTDNIVHRRFEIEFTATGPGVVNAVRAIADPAAETDVLAAFDNWMCEGWGMAELLVHARALIPATPELAAACRDISLIHALDSAPWIGAEPPDYKTSEVHWLNWKGGIYT